MTLTMSCDDDKIGTGQAVNWLEAKKAVEAKFTSQPTVHDKLCKQLDDYMLEPNEPEDSNSFNWWSANRVRFPDIATVARSYLAIPATSVTSERIFSKCGLTVSDRRSPLSPQHTEQIVFFSKLAKQYLVVAVPSSFNIAGLIVI
jgi:hypothetical protein